MAGLGERLGGHRRRSRAEVVVEHLDAGVLVEPDDLRDPAGRREGHDAALAPGARRTTAAVEVGLRVAGGVEVDDQADVVDVDAAGRDVGGDDDLHVTVGEALEVPLAHPLGQAALEVDCLRAGVGQRLGELGRALAGAGEDDRATVRADQPADGVDLVAEAADGQRVVGHRGDRAGVRVELVDARVTQVGAHQRVDVAVEGRAEQEPLAAGRGQADQLVDGRVEAEVAEVVGLVEDGDLDVVEEEVAVLEQVLEPAGGRDDEVGALPELPGLLLVRRAAVHGGQLETDRGSHGLQGAGHLVGELAGRYDDQGARVARTRAASGQPGQDRQPERERLARPGAGAAEHVVPRHGVGDHRGLHGGRLGDALLGEGGDELGRERGEDGHVDPSV